MHQNETGLPEGSGMAGEGRDFFVSDCARCHGANGIIDEKQVIDAKTLPKVKMPNRDGFVADPRPDVGNKAKAKK